MADERILTLSEALDVFKEQHGGDEAFTDKMDERRDLKLQNYGQCKRGCLVCNGVGYMRYDHPINHPEFGKMHPCPNNPNLEILAEAFGLKEEDGKLQWKDVTDLTDAKKAVKKLKKVLKLGYGWVYIWGSNGLGKSLLLRVAIAEWMRMGHFGSYVRMSDLMGDLRKAFDSEKPNIESTRKMEQWQRVSLLALDEFDLVNATDWVEEKRGILIDDRYENAVTSKRDITLFASEKDPKDYPSYLYDRFRDGRFTIIHLQGESVRPGLFDDEVPF
jgi:hypothetical protein